MDTTKIDVPRASKQSNCGDGGSNESRSSSDLTQQNASVSAGSADKKKLMDGRKMELVNCNSNCSIHLLPPCLNTSNSVIKRKEIPIGDLQPHLNNRPIKKTKHDKPLSSGKDFLKRYDLDKYLGSGSFGFTRLCIEKETGSRYACKIIEKSFMKYIGAYENVETEVKIMKHLPRHQNLIEFYGAYEDEHNKYILMELCTGGELSDQMSVAHNEDEAAAILWDIIQALKVCHKSGVMHRDLKPENLLYKTKESTSTLKVIDFGVSTFITPAKILEEGVGTTDYMAPEVFKRNDYGKEADIWSAGIILYVLLCGKHPFSTVIAEDDEELLEHIMNDEIDFEEGKWSEISKDAKDLAKGMLDRDRSKRLTVQQILKHPWMAKMESKQHSPTEVIPRRIDWQWRNYLSIC